ncbi:tetratricopeptide repeat protein [Psychrobacter sp. BI730]|uniref:tetratricopeptide repeat protein n=1 Tax=Psychrobacter sp. BI730 TaxID=2705463 RepID=UPI0015C8D01D|nr:tetratricopeptide repeat protein [Psychrobacter sp. BI730]NYR08589.1 sel1 repeat family protein [Psychrobacter sp. BI730]
MQRFTKTILAPLLIILVSALVGYLVLNGFDDRYIINNKKDLDKVTKLAMKGNIEAQYSLGNFYTNYNDQINQDEAFKWYKMAAEQDHIEAQKQMAYIYEQKWHYEYNKSEPNRDYLFQARDWMKKVSDEGDVDALAWLGQLYLDEFKNNEYGLKLIYQAAMKNDSWSQFKIGRYFSDDKSIYPHYSDVVDFPMSAEWYLKAATHEDCTSNDILDFCTTAFMDLARYYNKGLGVRQNLEQAKEWAGKACDHGEQNGCNLFTKINKN